MKTKRPPRSSGQHGSILVTTILTVAVIGIMVAGVLTLTVQEHRMEVRATAWNAVLPVAEAGIEEAMSHLQANGPGSAAGGILGVLGVAGWTGSGGTYSMQRNLNTNSYFQVSISPAIPPVISSRGYHRAPISQSYISRTVQITTTNTPLFTVAFGARYVIDMNGNGISSDSFDSTNPNLSTNGQYDPSKTSTNGDVVSVNGPVNIGNHTIKGDLYLGPTATFSSGNNQVTGTIYHDFNLDFPPVIPPANFASWSPVNPGLILVGLTPYNYAFFTDGDYTVATSGSIYVAPNVKVRLRVTASNFNPGTVRIAGNASSPGKLTVFMEGASSTMGGGMTVESGNAANFTYYGLPSNTSITYGGNSSFVGTIYAPNADLTLNGGGSNSGLIGSSITKSIQMNGHYDFHFDENLLKSSPPRGYTIASWQEL